MLVALAAAAKTPVRLIDAFTAPQKNPCFLHFAIGARPRMPYIPLAGTYGHKNS